MLMSKTSETGTRRRTQVRLSPRIKRILLVVGALLYVQTLIMAYNEGFMQSPYLRYKDGASLKSLCTNWTHMGNTSGRTSEIVMQVHQHGDSRNGSDVTASFVPKEQENNHNLTNNISMDDSLTEVDVDIEKSLLNSKLDGNIFYNAPPLMFNFESFFQGQNDPLAYGVRRQRKGFLTIGIPSVRRTNTTIIYILETLDSLINRTLPTERENITIVVLLSDANTTYNHVISKLICNKFKPSCRDGLIQIVIPPQQIYPDMTKLRQTYDDSLIRVQWRTKQNVDYAFLQLYSRNISSYYMQLEDDVITASGYFAYMRQFIEDQNDPWFCLEFSRLGFIGKLFHSEDLEKMAQYLLFFYDQMPGDILLNYLRQIMLQFKQIFYKYSLFQHIGKHSSLQNKTVTLKDSRFKDRWLYKSKDSKQGPGYGRAGFLPSLSLQTEGGDNPVADIITSLKPVKDFDARNPYECKSIIFVSLPPERGQFYRIVYQKPINVTRIVITTGDRAINKHFLDGAHLQVSTLNLDFPVSNSGAHCGVLTPLLNFVQGEVDTKAVGSVIPSNIKCIEIKMRKTSQSMLVLRHIAVFVDKRSKSKNRPAKCSVKERTDIERFAPYASKSRRHGESYRTLRPRFDAQDMRNPRNADRRPFMDFGANEVPGPPPAFFNHRQIDLERDVEHGNPFRMDRSRKKGQDSRNRQAPKETMRKQNRLKKQTSP